MYYDLDLLFNCCIYSKLVSLNSEFTDVLFDWRVSSNGKAFVLLIMFFSYDLILRALSNREEYFISYILIIV